MSELLTTGQMVDRLKVGEVAESDEGLQVTRSEFGAIVALEGGGLFLSNTAFLARKWRIPPQYVSFEEAMQALREGKRVSFKYLNDNDCEETIYFEKHYGAKFSLRREIEWADLFETKWTIEEEE